MKFQYRQLLSASSILAATAFVASTQSALSSALFTSGHGDFAVGFHEGEFEFGYHLGEDGDTAFVSENGIVRAVDDEEFEADELIVRVTEQFLVSSDADPSLLGGTGATPGSTVFQISQLADGISSPILGIGTEELLQPTGTIWSDVTYTLNSSSGPGLFTLLFNDGDFDFLISENQSIDTFTFPADDHNEHTWIFTEAGTYDLNFTAEATRTVDGLAEDFRATETFTFQVVPEPSSALLLLGSSLGFLLRRRRRG